MKVIRETSRLVARQLTLDDAPFILKLLNSPGWLQYIGDRNVHNVEQAYEYLRNGALASYDKYGYGLWLVQDKSGMPLGMSGFLRRDYLPYPDLGFAFMPDHSGHGYAYEISEALLDHAWLSLKFEKVLAITLPSNHSSIKLLTKLGFADIGRITPPGSTDILNLYELSFE